MEMSFYLRQDDTIPQCLETPVSVSRNVKRGREVLTPTGTTPLQQPKRVHEVEERCRWTLEEKKELVRMVDSINSDKIDWESITKEHNGIHGKSRSAKACKSAYARFKVFASEEEIEKSVTSCDMSTQTLISVPPGNVVIWDSYIPNGRDPKLKEKEKMAEDSNEKNENDCAPLRKAGETHVQQKPSTKVALNDHDYGKKSNAKKEGKKITKAVLNRAKNNENICTNLMEFTQPCLESTNLSINDVLHLKMALAVTHDLHKISSVIVSQPALRQIILEKICQEVGERPKEMKNKTEGFVSVLMKKDVFDLENFKMEESVSEFMLKFPELLRMLISIMIPADKITSKTAISQIIPRLALLYSVIMQSRCHELSRMQRVLSICLADSISDQRVYDRLNRLGIVVPYCVSISLNSNIGQRYPSILAKALQEGKYLRLIGDNLNFSVGVNQESIDTHKHIEHMFLSTALISENLFMDLPLEPQVPLDQLTTEHLLLNREEYLTIRKDVVKLVVDMVCQYLPQLAHLKASVPSSFVNENCRISKTTVVLLPCLPYNEQCYQDDVKILDWYEALLSRAVKDAGINEDMKFQIGGDQLTRERFSEALLLRLENKDPKSRFAHIGRCVAEFFHLGMNYMEKCMFGILWGNDQERMYEVGTLRAECERVCRHSVDPNVNKAYDADKMFLKDYTAANIINAVMHFFGMTNENDAPSINIPPAFDSPEKQKDWVYSTFSTFVDKYIFPCWSNEDDHQTTLESTQDYPEYITLTLANGETIKLPLDVEREDTLRHQHPDKVKEYHHLALEVGCTFLYFLELMRTPDRDRILGILKMMMLQLRGKSTKAKYPREILRILIQQYSLMGQREAHQVMQASFVNTSGKPNGCVPADLVQEWNVQESKKHIKHMFANKTSSNILIRTSALPSIHAIASNFDEAAGTLIRCKRHSHKENEKDVKMMIKDIMERNPYQVEERRYYASFKNIKKSLMENVDGLAFHEWFHRSKKLFSR